MSDRKNSPGDDGQLTQGDVQNHVMNFFLAEMQPQFSRFADERKNLQSALQAGTNRPLGSEEVAMLARSVWLTGAETAAYKSAVHSVRTILTMLESQESVGPLTKQEITAEEVEEQKRRNLAIAMLDRAARKAQLPKTPVAPPLSNTPSSPTSQAEDEGTKLLAEGLRLARSQG